MNSRQRVQETLAFRKVDRAPRELWALPWVGQYAAEESNRLNADFPGDFTGPWGLLSPSSRATGTPCRKGEYTDEWGCGWSCGEDGVVGEVKHPPLADWSALASFTPPWEMLQDPKIDPARAAYHANAASSEAKFFRIGTSLRPFERMQFLRGTEALYMDMAYDSAEFRRLREMVHEFFLRELEITLKVPCDGVCFMDDWGAQNSLLISPAMWREFFKPLYKDYCDRIRAAGAKVFFHSDGCILDIYEDLIEIGVSAVNSQLFCMDIEEIARRFKGHITFWGEICRQHVLPFGTVEDVRRAVGRVRRALDDGRGGVIAQCEWGVRNPPANIRAVYESWLAPIETLP